MKSIKLKLYNKGKYYQFMDVLENLALNLIVNKEVEWMIKKMKIEKESNEDLNNLNPKNELFEQKKKVQELKKEIQTGMLETEKLHK